jgi:hypothetical protein
MDSARRDACHGDRDGRAPQSAIRNPQSAIRNPQSAMKFSRKEAQKAQNQDCFWCLLSIFAAIPQAAILPIY